MPDIATISAFLGSIKTATDIAKAIKGADASLEKAELKLKIAELIETLADVKMNAVEVQDLIQEKDKRIKELEKSLENKSNLIRHKGKYFETDEDGKIAGEPYCSKCWEVDKIAVHLRHIEEKYYICPLCKNNYGSSPNSWESEGSTNIQTYW